MAGEKKIIVSAPAEADIGRISDFLDENRSPELAIRLIEAFYRKLDLIDEMPGIGALSLKTPGVRKIRVDQYNMVYYQERETDIAILRVFDTRSNPDENPY